MEKISNFINYKEEEFGNSLIKMDQFYEVKNNTTVLTANCVNSSKQLFFIAVFKGQTPA